MCFCPFSNLDPKGCPGCRKSSDLQLDHAWRKRDCWGYPSLPHFPFFEGPQNNVFSLSGHSFLVMLILPFKLWHFFNKDPTVLWQMPEFNKVTVFKRELSLALLALTSFFFAIHFFQNLFFLWLEVIFQYWYLAHFDQRDRFEHFDHFDHFNHFDRLDFLLHFWN